MLTIGELLEDQHYRKFFLTKPRMPKAPRLKEPWRLYVQLEKAGPWRKKDFWDYADAVKAFDRLRKKGLHDASITCRPIAFAPPTRVVKVKGQFHTNAKGERQQVTREIVWKPTLPALEDAHVWCGYCRRPTVFDTFSKHHAFAGALAAFIDPGAPRCTICGIRLEGLRGSAAWARA